jgi:hypothetical protein
MKAMLTSREKRVIALWGIGTALAITGFSLIFYYAAASVYPTIQITLTEWLPIISAVPFFIAMLIISRGHPTILQMLRKQKSKIDSPS